MAGQGLRFNHRLRLETNRLRSTLAPMHFLPIFQGMVANAKKTDYECPICSGRGRVPGRLPGRTRLCPECHATGRTTPIRREALLKRMKTRARA
jgi:DnaJ-class molecular chaperone